MIGYIALLDILGFNKKNQKCPIGDILIVIERLSEIIKSQKTTEISSAELNGKIQNYQNTISKIFYADTLMLWETSENDESKQIVMDTIRSIMGYSYASKIPMRCGIAFGEFIVDERNAIFAGKAIADAHDVESMQNWIGIGFHESCLDDPWFKKQADNDEKSTINLVEYLIPTNERKNEGLLDYSMNWIPQIKVAQSLGQELNNILNYGPEHEKFQNFDLFLREMKQRYTI